MQLQQPLATLKDVVDQLPSGRAVHSEGKKKVDALLEAESGTGAKRKKRKSLKDVLAVNTTPAAETTPQAAKQFTVRQPFSVVVPCKPGGQIREVKYSEGSIWTTNWRERSTGSMQVSYEPLPIQQPVQAVLPLHGTASTQRQEVQERQSGGMLNQAAHYVVSKINQVAGRNGQTGAQSPSHHAAPSSAGSRRRVSPESSGPAEKPLQQPPLQQPRRLQPPLHQPSLRADGNRQSSPATQHSPAAPRVYPGYGTQPVHQETAGGMTYAIAVSPASNRAPVQSQSSKMSQTHSASHRSCTPQVAARAAAQPNSHPVQQQETTIFCHKCQKYHVVPGTAVPLVCLHTCHLVCPCTEGPPSDWL